MAKGKSELADRIRSAYQVEIDPGYSVITIRSPRTGERIDVIPIGQRRISLPKAEWEGTEEELARILLGEKEWRRAAWLARWGSWDAQAVAILRRSEAEAGVLSGDAPAGQIAVETQGELHGYIDWTVGRTSEGTRVLEFRYATEDGVLSARHRIRGSIPDSAMAEVAEIVDKVKEIGVGIKLGSEPIRSCQSCNRAFHIAEGAEIFAIARLGGWSRRICPACRQGIAFAMRRQEGIWIPGAFLSEDGSLRPGPLPPHPEAVFLITDGQRGLWGFPKHDGFRGLIFDEWGVEPVELPGPTPPPQMSPDGWIRAGRFRIGPSKEIRQEKMATFFPFVVGPKGTPVEAEISAGVWRLWVSQEGEIRWSAEGWLEASPRGGASFIVPADGAMADAGGRWIAVRRWPPEVRWGDLRGAWGEAQLSTDPMEAAAFPLGDGWLFLLGHEAFLLGPGGAARGFPFPRAFAKAWEIPGEGRVLSGPGGTFVVFQQESRFFDKPVAFRGVATADKRAAIVLKNGSLLEVAPGRIQPIGEGFQAVAGSGSLLAALDNQGRLWRFPPGGGGEVAPLSVQPQEVQETDLVGLGRGMFLIRHSLGRWGWVLRGNRLDPVQTYLVLSPEAEETDGGIVLQTAKGWMLFPDNPEADPVPLPDDAFWVWRVDEARTRRR